MMCSHLPLVGPSSFPLHPWNKRVHNVIQMDDAGEDFHCGSKCAQENQADNAARGVVGILRSGSPPGDDPVGRWRVRFADEAPGPRGLVTGTMFRPRTTEEERILLYYSSHDYAFFALEDSLEEAERRESREAEKFGWEDCIAYYDFARCNDVIFAEEDERGESCAIHKVETLRDLRI